MYTDRRIELSVIRTAIRFTNIYLFFFYIYYENPFTLPCNPVSTLLH
jgi:hypothetical protein